MKRKDLEHLIRAAAAITNEYEIMVVGSQSILGAAPDAPEVLLMSMEADMYPLRCPDLADLIDGAIGELSPFQERFGYYAQGVGPETAILPAGWEGRVVKIQNGNTDLKIGYCLEPHDLAASKLAAGRDKDWPFVETMVRHGITSLGRGKKTHRPAAYSAGSPRAPCPLDRRSSHAGRMRSGRWLKLRALDQHSPAGKRHALAQTLPCLVFNRRLRRGGERPTPQAWIGVQVQAG
jgi:hypothetical protein